MLNKCTTLCTVSHLKLHGGMLAQAGVIQYGGTFFAFLHVEESVSSPFNHTG